MVYFLWGGLRSLLVFSFCFWRLASVFGEPWFEFPAI